MATPSFHNLTVARVRPEAAGSVAISFAVPAELQDRYHFEPGQFLTLRHTIDNQDVRRSYSICSTPKRLQEDGVLEIGIRPVNGGVFSNWAARSLKAGDTLAVMTPDGRFTSQRARALHRVGFAAGSGITPILSIMKHVLETQPDSKFTLVFGNRAMSSVMFNEDLQDLKDRYKNRVTMVHILSRQAQESDLLEGRIDAAKVRAIIDTLLPVGSMEEVFVCGPDEMIQATESALKEAGVKPERIRTERFTSPSFDQLTPQQRAAAVRPKEAGGDVKLTVLLDGKEHHTHMTDQQRILDAALSLGLDLPYSCKAGVCCTCRGKVLEGQAVMDKNFTLEPQDVAKGFVLSCQARPTSKSIKISFDER